MKKLFLYIYVSFGCIVQAQTVNPFLPDAGSPIVPEGMKLVWNDEFNVNGPPDAANWQSESGFVRNQELQYYKAENAICDDGVLKLTGKRDTVENAKYVRGSTDWRTRDSLAYWTSGSMKTQGLKSFQYGRIDVRARIDTTYGSWPAVWQKGISGSWPACGEVDIMEFYSKRILANAIFGAAGKPNYSGCIFYSFSSVAGKDMDWTRKFHLWTEIWTADTIKIYMDNHLLNMVPVAKMANPAGTIPANGFKQPHFFLLNQAIGSVGGIPLESTSRFQFEVDYIRIFQNIETATEDVVQQKSVVLFPNPVNDILHIKSDKTIECLTILDLSGREMLRQFSPAYAISTSFLEKGYYLVHIQHQNGDIYKQILMKI